LSASTKSDRTKKREDKIQQVRSLETEINEFKNSREKQLQEQAVRMRNQIVEEIMKVVNDKVKSDHYDLVLDKSGQSLNGVQIVLHSEDSMEFSDDIVVALNKNRPAPGPVAPAAPIATPAGLPTATPKK
jgi:Skp family chaperone for outer membrane proteins